MPTATAPVSAAATTISFPVIGNFDVDSAVIGGAGSPTINASADRIKKDGAKVALNGNTDKTGVEAKNFERTKGRAKAVQDALIVAGIGQENIGMKPSLFVTGAVDDNEARRVVISKQ